MQGEHAGALASVQQQFQHRKLADAANALVPDQAGAQRARHGAAGGKKLNIDAARVLVARRVDKLEAVTRAGARPTHAPLVHLVYHLGRLAAQQFDQARVA